MLDQKPLTRSQKWAEHKAEQRAERAARKAVTWTGPTTGLGAHSLSVLKRSGPIATGRAARRARMRPNRKQGGRSAVHVDRGLFNIATGTHQPLPRP